MQIVRDYYNQGLKAVRGVLGQDMVIYIGDIFEANKFNDGFWQGSTEYQNTFLDSHYYQGTKPLSGADLAWFFALVLRQRLPLLKHFSVC